MRAARDGKASEAQVAILRRAAGEGVMSYPLAQESLDSYFGCLTGTGISYLHDEVSPGAAFPTLQYSVAATDAPAMDACCEEHFYYVDVVYQLQPAVDTD